MLRLASIFRCALIAAALLLPAATTLAATYTWDSDGNSANGVTDGSGTWSIANADWFQNTSTADVAWLTSPITSADTAAFGGSGSTGGTVTFSGSFAAGGILFNGTDSGAYSIVGTGTPTLTLGSGGITVNSGAGAEVIGSSTAASNFGISLTGSQAWTNGATNALTVYSGVSAASTSTLTIGGVGNVTLNGPLTNGAGALGLLMSDSGTLSLTSATSNFSGGTTIAGGTVSFVNGALGSGNVTFTGGTLLYASGNTQNLGARIKNSTSPVAINTNGNTIFSSSIDSSNSGGLTKSGTGVLYTGAVNAYSGPTVVSGGTLKLGSYIVPTADTSQSDYAPDGRLAIHAIDGTGMSAAGSPTATAGNTPQNAMWLSNGTTQTWITFDLGSVQTITGFHLWNYNESAAGDFTRGVKTAGVYYGNSLLAQGSSYGAGGAAWGTLAQNFTFNEANGSTAYAGNDYSFTTPVTTRYLQIYATSNFGGDLYTGISEIGFYGAGSLPAASPVQLASGASLDLAGNSQTIASLADGTGGGGAVINSATGTPVTLTFSPSSGSTAFSGIISDSGSANAISLLMSGAGTQTLTGLNSYSGTTTIAGGTLTFGTGSLGSSGNVTFTGGTLRYAGGNTQTVSNRIKNSTAPVTIDTNGNNVVFAAPLDASNSGGLTKAGAGTLSLGGTSAYSGTTVVSGGTLKLGGSYVVPTADSSQSDFTGDGRLAIHAIDGTGMSAAASPVATTTSTIPGGTMWLSNNTSQTWITFDLGSVQTLTGFHLWNYNESTSGLFAQRGIKTAGVYSGSSLLAGGSSYASAGAAWGTLVQNVTLNPANGLSTYAGNDYSFASPVTTRYIQLDVTGNFAGSNTYTGISEIGFYNNTGNLPATTAVQIASGATLDLSGNSQTVASLADGTGGGGSIINSAPTLPATLTVNPASGSTTFSGSISDNGVANAISLLQLGAGTQVLAGNNTYSGTTTINAGTLQIGGAGVLGGGNYSPTISNSGALVFSTSASQTLSGVISGGGSLSQQGSGTLTLTAANNYNGATTVSGGVLVLDHSAANLGALSATAVSIGAGGTLRVKGNTGIASGGSLATTASGAQISLLDGTINTLSVGGGITFAAGSVLSLDIGASSGLNDQITASGAVSIGGVGMINIAGATVTSGNYTVATASGGFTPGGGDFVVGTHPNGHFSFSFTNSTATAEILTITAPPFAATTYWTGAASRAAADAANNWSTGSSNSNWSTDLAGAHDANQVPGGVTDVVFAASNAVPSSGSTLTTQLDGSFTIKGLAIAVPTTSPTQITSTVINPNGNTLTIGADGLTLAATSLSSATVGSGSIALAGSQNWANNHATLGLTVNANISASSGATTLTLNGTGAGGVTLSGAIFDGGGTLALVVNQAGVTLLSGTNTYSGGTTVSSGTLRLGSSASLPSGGPVAVNGTLDLNTFSPSLGALSGSGTIDTLAGGTPTLTVGASNSSGTFAGTLQNSAGSLALLKVGSGNISLTGASTFSGGTTISAGVLGVNADAALGTLSSGVNFSGNGTLQAVADNILLGASRALTINNGVVGTIDTQSYTTTVAGTIGGGGGLAKAGSGTLILNGSKNYSGGTTVNLGSLQLGDGASNIGSVSGNILNNATVNFANPSAQTFAGVVSGGGTFQKSAAGTLVLTGINTYTGPTVISGGVLRVTALGSSNVGLVNGSFENPPQTTFQYYGAMTTAQQQAFVWTAGGNASAGGPAIVRSGWGYTTPYPDGGQVISVQKDASIVQTVNFPTAGTYQLFWSAELRPSYVSNPINVQLDGSTINTFNDTNQASWTTYGLVFNVATAGNHTIGFAGTVTATDQTVGLDNVVLAPASNLPTTTAVQITNSGAVFDINDSTTVIGSLAGVAGASVALGNGTLAVGADGTSTSYAGTISDTGGLSSNTGGRLIKVGPGVLTLSGINTYTGGTILNGGELAFDSPTALPATPTAAISFSGGTLRYTANNTTDYSGRFSNAAGQAYSIDTNGLNISFGTPLTSVGGSFAKSGAGVLTFNAANTYTGNTSISGGTLRLGVAGALPATGALVMSSTGVLDLNGNSASVTDVVASANTNLITDNSSGTGVTTLTISAFFTTINSLITDGPTQHVALDVSGITTNNPLFPLANANTFSGGVTLLGSAGTGTRLRINALATTVGSPGAIVSSPFGTGPITLGLGPLDQASILIDTVNNNTVDNAIVFNTALGTDFPGIRIDTAGNTLAGTITANLADARFSSDAAGAASVSLTGQITGTNGLNVSSNGAGTLTVTLNNAAGSNNYQGATTIGASSTIALAAANQIPHGSSAGNVTDNGSLNLGGFSTTINGLNGAGGIDGGSGAPTLTIGDNNASGTFSGAIRNSAGTLSLVKIGSGTQALTSAQSTYSGSTTISGGTLKLGGGGSFESPINATSESYFPGDDRAPIHAVDGSGQSVPGSPTATAGVATAHAMWLSNGTTQTWITFDLGSVQTISGFHLWNYNETSAGGYNTRGIATAGVYTGASLLAQGSSYASGGSAWGTLAQSFSFSEATGLPTYTGSDYSFTTPVTTRYLQFYVTSKFGTVDAYTGISEIGFYTNAGSLPVTTQVQIASGANLDLNGAIQTIASLADGAVGGGSVINSNSAVPAGLILNPAIGTATFSGTISDMGVLGAVSLTMTGTGTQILAGVNSYVGGTTVNGGTLALSAAGTLGATTGALTVNGGVLDLNGTSQGVGSLSGTGGTILNSAASTAATLTVGNGDASGTFAGLIADNAGGSGTVALTKVGAGTITLAGLNTDSGGTTLTSGTLRLSGAGTLGAPAGALTVNGGVLDLNGTSQGVGSLSGTGGTILNSAPSTASTLTVGNGDASGTFSALIADNAGSGGTVALAKVGAGTITLAGSNAYSGGTTITGGTLRVTNTNGSAAGSGPVIVGDGTNPATLAGSTLANQGSISGSVTLKSAAALAGGSGATLTLTGGLTLNDGSLSSFNLTQAGVNNHAALVAVTGGFIGPATTTHTINFTGLAVLGTYDLYSYDSGSPTLSQFALGTLPAGGFSYQLSIANDQVDLLVQNSSASAAWNFAGNGAYGGNSNWDPTKSPSGVGLIVTFGGGTTNQINSTTAGSNAIAVSIDGAYTAGSLVFDNSAVSYTLANGGGSLTLDNGGAVNGGFTGAVVTVNHGSHTIASNLTLADSAGTTFNLAGGSSLAVSGVIAGNGANQRLALTGGGTLTLSNANTYNGGNAVNSGTLRTTVNGALGGGPLAVNSAGTATPSVDVNSNESVGALTGGVSGSGTATVQVEPSKSLGVAPTAGTATFAGTLNLVAGNMTPGGTLAKSGAGTELLTGPVQLNDGSVLKVSGGTLRVNASGGTIGAGVTANVSSTGTLELAGTYSALGTTTPINRTFISNNSTASAGVLVSGGNQQVGGIEGTGNVQVTPASGLTDSLTADHIIAGSLIIGGDANSSAVVTIAASNPDGSPLASSGFALAGSLASSAPFASGALSSSNLSAAAGSSSDGMSFGGSSFGSLNLGGSVAAVPEPSTIMLLVFGSLACLPPAMRRRIRK